MDINNNPSEEPVEEQAVEQPVEQPVEKSAEMQPTEEPVAQSVQPVQPVQPAQQAKNDFNKRLVRRYISGLLTGVLATIVLLAGVFIGFIFVGSRKGVVQTGQQSEALLSDPVVQKLEKLNAIIDAYYYKTDVDQQQRADGLYKGLMESLGDPYSVYYTEEELIELRNDTQGVYYGIGAYVSMDTTINLPRISGVMEGTPAEEAGLMANDIIYEINKESTAGLTLEEVVGKIKGEQGTTVHLTLVRDGETDYVELDVMRRQVEVPTVSTKILEDDIGYLRITEFDTVTSDQFKEGMAELRAHGVKGLILDLRGNPGGSLETVCNIGEQLLPEGKIVYTEDRNGEGETYYSSGEHEIDIPLVVLVDQYSASASEILAGAIKDYKIGTLVGVTTYGKGIVQSILDLKDGTAVKLTVSSYYTPNGVNIHGIGIEPDVVCEFDSEAYAADKTDNQLNKGIEVLKDLIDN